MGFFTKKNEYERKMKKPLKFYNSPISEECWNLDSSFIDFIVPRLKLYRKDASRVIIYDFSIVDEIIEGFELYQDIYNWPSDPHKAQENMKKVRHSMELFAKHWMEFNW